MGDGRLAAHEARSIASRVAARLRRQAGRAMPDAAHRALVDELTHWIGLSVGAANAWLALGAWSKARTRRASAAALADATASGAAGGAGAQRDRSGSVGKASRLGGWLSWATGSGAPAPASPRRDASLSSLDLDNDNESGSDSDSEEEGDGDVGRSDPAVCLARVASKVHGRRAAAADASAEDDARARAAVLSTCVRRRRYLQACVKDAARCAGLVNAVT